MSTDVSTAPPKAQPVRNIQALLAAASVIVAGLSGVAFLADQKWVAGVGAIWGLLMAGYNAYQSQALPQKLVPFADAAAYINSNGVKVAGPASSLKNGTQVSELETVTAHAALAALEGQQNKPVSSNYADTTTPSLTPVVGEDEPAPGDILVSEDDKPDGANA